MRYINVAFFVMLRYKLSGKLILSLTKIIFHQAVESNLRFEQRRETLLNIKEEIGKSQWKCNNFCATNVRNS